MMVAKAEADERDLV
ncbi:hypothetical protein ACTXBX_004162 [Escherichia coli]|nr:hypothetical protein [Escherichia coli]EGD9272618.1 hypothetical protein [Escherichia coli]EGE1918344.1 hypothetical protein [Escherichia coli]